MCLFLNIKASKAKKKNDMKILKLFDKTFCILTQILLDVQKIKYLLLKTIQYVNKFKSRCKCSILVVVVYYISIKALYSPLELFMFFKCRLYNLEAKALKKTKKYPENVLLLQINSSGLTCGDRFQVP